MTNEPKIYPTVRALPEVGSTQDFEAMNQAIAVNNIHSIIDKKFSLDQTQAAFEYLEQGSHFGKVAIKM